MDPGQVPAPSAGAEDVELEGRLNDLPGQIDSQRGRTSYSQAEKAFEQFSELVDARRRDTSFLEQVRQQTVRQQEELHQQRVRQNEELHVIRMQVLSGAQSASQGQETGLSATLIALLDKLVTQTPPVTKADGTPG